MGGGGNDAAVFSAEWQHLCSHAGCGRPSLSLYPTVAIRSKAMMVLSPQSILPGLLFFFFFRPLYSFSSEGFCLPLERNQLKKKKKERCAGCILGWREERNDSLTLPHTPPRHPTALKRLFFLVHPHSVAIPGLCGRRLLCACVCPPGRLQPSVNERYRWLEHECVTSGLVFQSSRFPASIVSLGTDLFRGSILV